jgi:cell division protein FtsB
MVLKKKKKKKKKKRIVLLIAKILTDLFYFLCINLKYQYNSQTNYT